MTTPAAQGTKSSTGDSAAPTELGKLAESAQDAAKAVKLCVVHAWNELAAIFLSVPAPATIIGKPIALHDETTLGHHAHGRTS